MPTKDFTPQLRHSSAKISIVVCWEQLSPGVQEVQVVEAHHRADSAHIHVEEEMGKKQVHDSSE